MRTEYQEILNSRLRPEERAIQSSPVVSASIIRYVMKQHGMTQKEVALLMGVDASFVSRVCQGKRSITLSHIETLSRRLEIPTAVLVWRAIRPASPSKRKETIYGQIDELLSSMFPDLEKQPVAPDLEQNGPRSSRPASERRNRSRLEPVLSS